MGDRAERRRAERAAQKALKQAKKQGQPITQSDVAMMWKAEEQRERISNAVFKRKLVESVDRELGDKYYKQAYLEAYDKANHDFDLDSQTVFFISMALAIKEANPNYGPDAIERRIQRAIDLNREFATTFDHDLDAWKLRYAIEIGRAWELVEVDDPKEAADGWQTIKQEEAAS